MAILTVYVRQERSADGLWADAVRDKVFLKILKRLDGLKINITKKQVPPRKIGGIFIFLYRINVRVWNM